MSPVSEFVHLHAYEALVQLIDLLRCACEKSLNFLGGCALFLRNTFKRIPEHGVAATRFVHWEVGFEHATVGTKCINNFIVPRT